MNDDPLPTPSGIDAEPQPNDERAGDDRPTDDRSSDERPGDRRPNEDQSREEPPDREPTTGPGRATDPPPDRGEGAGSGARESEPDAADDDTEESEPLEYRLERLRLVRTVVTLAVVVARLIRSL